MRCKQGSDETRSVWFEDGMNRRSLALLVLLPALVCCGPAVLPPVDPAFGLETAAPVVATIPPPAPPTAASSTPLSVAAPEPVIAPPEPVAAPARKGTDVAKKTELLGKIASRNGADLVVDSDASLAPGSKGELYARFAQQLGPMLATGWLGIAAVTVVEAKGGKLHLTIDAEKSIILLNGKKVDHFGRGAEVKLEPGP
jgi:hypothetical protein